MRPLCVFGYEFARAHREAKKSPPRSRRNGTSNPEWPANVCALFHKLLQDGDVREITCVSVDKPMQSKTPFFCQSFKRNTKGYDRCGGGAVIPYTYYLTCFDESAQRVLKFILENISSFKGSEKVVMLDEKSFSCLF